MRGTCTPTTAEVRERHTAYVSEAGGVTERIAKRNAEFDRWLASVKAEALDEFAALLRDRYPEDVFPKPSKDDYANLHVALNATRVTLDRISADMLRRAGAQAEREATEIRAIAAEGEGN